MGTLKGEWVQIRWKSKNRRHRNRRSFPRPWSSLLSRCSCAAAGAVCGRLGSCVLGPPSFGWLDECSGSASVGRCGRTGAPSRLRLQEPACLQRRCATVFVYSSSTAGCRVCRSPARRSDVQGRLRLGRGLSPAAVTESRSCAPVSSGATDTCFHGMQPHRIHSVAKSHRGYERRLRNSSG